MSCRLSDIKSGGPLEGGTVVHCHCSRLNWPAKAVNDLSSNPKKKLFLFFKEQSWPPAFRRKDQNTLTVKQNAYFNGRVIKTGTCFRLSHWNQRSFSIYFCVLICHPVGSDSADYDFHARGRV